MKYYPFYVGDYAAHTRHLSLLEDLAYRRLLDLYYLNEGPPRGTAADCARAIGMRDHVAEVQAVLAEFFLLDEEGWHHTRCDEELARYQAMTQGGRRGAAARWAKEREAMPQPSPAIEPPNANQNQNQNQKETSTKSPKNTSPRVERPESVTEQVWSEFVALRKARRAPVTATVVAGLEREAGKAGITLQEALQTTILRGWQSFKADWVSSNGPASRGLKSQAPSFGPGGYGAEQIQEI